MKNKIWQMCFLFVFACIQFCAHDLYGFPKESLIENATCCCERGETSEIVLSSTEDLYFGKNEILLDLDGAFYKVVSLEKNGNQIFINYKTVAYCAGGTHSLCRHCHLCHLPGCHYYVRPCSNY